MSPHLLSIDSLSRDHVDHLMRLAARMEPIAQRRQITRVLEGAVLGNLFFEASTRTRVSFHAAFCRLGGSVCDTTGFTFSSMAKGESLYDTSRVMSGYCDAIVMRHPEQGSVAEFASATQVPVINAGDGPGEHPSQALLDLYTIDKEFARQGKSLRGAHVLMTGDLKYGRTVHSLTQALAKFEGNRFYFIAPDALAMPAYILKMLEEKGIEYSLHGSIEEVVPELDILYMTRVQKERLDPSEYANVKAQFVLRAADLAGARANPKVLHPLPRNDEIATDVDKTPHAYYFQQAGNGIFARQALLALVLNADLAL